MVHGRSARAKVATLTLVALSAILLAVALAAAAMSATGAPSAQVRWNLPFGEPISLDYTKDYNYSENTVLSNICDSLLRESPSGKVEPDLASSVAHPSPTKWVYTIRKGVTFWDGNPLTADDVAFSLNRHLDPKVGSFYALPWALEIKSVAKTAPNQVTVTTKRPDLLINELMVTGLGTVAEMSYIETKGKAFGTPKGGVMCSGPFELSSWKPGSSITITRNPNYWDAAHRAKVAGVTFSFIVDQTAVTNALLTGAVDATFETPASAIGRLRSASNGRLRSGASTQFLALYPTGTGPLKDLRLRQALSLAIDRAGIAKTVYGGLAHPMKSIVDPAGVGYARPIYKSWYARLPSPSVDIAKAKSLVQQAGSPSAPITIAFTAGDPSALQVTNAIVSAGQEIGLHLVAREFPPNQFVGLFFDPKARKGIDALVTELFADLREPLEFFYLGALPGPQDLNNYTNATVSKNVRLAAATTVPTKRARYVIAATKQWDADLPLIPLVTLPERLFLSKHFAGVPAVFPYQYYPWATLIRPAS